MINAEDLGLERRGYYCPDRSETCQSRGTGGQWSVYVVHYEHLSHQLGLVVKDRQAVELANGSIAEYDIVGPIEVRFANRLTSCNAFVFPGEAEILLGAIPMEDMDVLIEPRNQELVVTIQPTRIWRKKS